MSFAIEFGNKYGKKLVDTATKTGIDAAKAASKRVVQKTAEATGHFIGNKIADKISSLGKKKVKKKKTKDNKSTYPPEKRQQTIDDLMLLRLHIIMEYQKITNLFSETPEEVHRFITRKWIEVHDQSGKGNNRYLPSKQIRFKTSIRRSDLCDFSDAYIAMKWTINVTRPNNNAHDEKLALKNKALFVSCTSKINNTLIDNAEDLDVVMPMYNLLEYSKNDSKTTGSLWNYYRDKPNTAANNNINYSIKDSKSLITKQVLQEN